MWRSYRSDVGEIATAQGCDQAFSFHPGVVNNDGIRDAPGAISVVSRLAMISRPHQRKRAKKFKRRLSKFEGSIRAADNDEDKDITFLKVFLFGKSLNIASSATISTVLRVKERKEVVEINIPRDKWNHIRFGPQSFQCVELCIPLPDGAYFDIPPDIPKHMQSDEYNYVSPERYFLNVVLVSSFDDVTMTFTRQMLLTGTWMQHQELYWKEVYASIKPNLLLQCALSSAVFFEQTHMKAVVRDVEIESSFTMQSYCDPGVESFRDLLVRLDFLIPMLDISSAVLFHKHLDHEVSPFKKKIEQVLSEGILKTFPPSYDEVSNLSKENEKRKLLTSVSSLEDFGRNESRPFHHLLLPDDYFATMKSILAAHPSLIYPPQTIPIGAYIPPSNALLRSTALGGVASNIQEDEISFDGNFSQTIVFRDEDVVENGFAGKRLLNPSSPFMMNMFWACEPFLQVVNWVMDGDCVVSVKRGKKKGFASKLLGMNPSLNRLKPSFSRKKDPTVVVNEKNIQKIKKAAARRNNFFELRTVCNWQERMQFLAELLFDPGFYNDAWDQERAVEALFPDNRIPGPGCLGYVGIFFESNGSDEAQRANERLESMGVDISGPSFEIIKRWICQIIAVKRPVCQMLAQYPLIAVVGTQGVGKTAILQSLGFEAKSAWGSDANTKAFDAYMFHGTNVRIVDCMAFTEVLEGTSPSSTSSKSQTMSTAAQKHSSKNMTWSKDFTPSMIYKHTATNYTKAVLASAQFVIVATHNIREWSKDMEEIVHLLQHSAADVCFLKTKFDQEVKQYHQETMEGWR
eukprot:m.21489 g.21489  ORF g.21489 m.21489 type:complete len:801 (+) comp8724_c2_seq1:554-2956(+)